MGGSVPWNYFGVETPEWDDRKFPKYEEENEHPFP